VRHQIFADRHVPFTSKNGSASIRLSAASSNLAGLIDLCRATMRECFIPGGDPGLCAAPVDAILAAITAFAHRCESQIVTQREARDLAHSHGLQLEGLGGTEGGVIGALAAIGLGREANSGRLVQWREWSDDLSGEQPAAAIFARDMLIRDRETGAEIGSGTIDVGKHLRPNLRSGGAVLFVEPCPDSTADYRAVRLV
jgi:hypothetical protein